MRLPGGGVRVRRSALSAWLRRLEEEDTQDGQEQTADGQLRRQVLGHQEDRRQRQRRRGTGSGGRSTGSEHCKSFKSKTLADGFLDDLKDAARDRRPFSPRTGLPEPPRPPRSEMVTWYEHARAYAEAKWASLAPVSRRSVAEALVTVTIALTGKEKGAPEARVLRQALFAWAFNPATREQRPAARDRRRPGLGRPRLAARQPRWTTRPRCGSRWARAPRPWTASRPPGRRSGASGRCSTTPSATPSN